MEAPKSEQAKLLDRINEARRKQAAAQVEALRLVDSAPWLQRALPYIPYFNSPRSDALKQIVRAIATEHRGKFAFASSWEPEFLASVASFGFLPMAHRLDDFTGGKDATQAFDERGEGPCPYFLMPKLHTERCLLRLGETGARDKEGKGEGGDGGSKEKAVKGKAGDLHVSKSVRKKAKRCESIILHDLRGLLIAILTWSLLCFALVNRPALG